MSNVHVCRRVGIITNLFRALSVKKEGFLKGRYFAFFSPYVSLPVLVSLCGGHGEQLPRVQEKPFHVCVCEIRIPSLVSKVLQLSRKEREE